ncbi:MAG: Ig-like domain-containing protein [Thermoleophilia bacterium]
MRFSAKTAIFFIIMTSVMMMTAGHAFAAADCPPAVTEIDASSYWSNYPDYRDRLLTVDETLRNDSACQTCRLQLEGAEASNGVSLETPMPRYIGNLSQTTLSQVSMKFRIPHGVGSFHSRVRLVCLPDAGDPPRPTQPVEQNLMIIDPDFALANEGCPADPVPETGIHSSVMDTTYGPRRFVVTVKDADGNPVAGKSIKWSLSNNYDFRFLDSTAVTDEAGQAYAVVTPPQYFICIIPYYSKGMTLVGATSEDGMTSESQFAYTRCAPPGSSPPWLKLAGTS